MDTTKRIHRKKLAKGLVGPIMDAMDAGVLDEQDVEEVLKQFMEFVRGGTPQLVIDSWIITQMRRAGYGESK